MRWSKQMLAASEQRVEDLELRWVDAGQQLPAAGGHAGPMRWFGAGWPDYTWLFGTDGEYTAYAAVAAGQFGVDQGPPAGAARRVGGDQPRQRQDRARGDPGRRGLLRRRRRPGQHRRVVEVPLGGGPGLALDRRRGASCDDLYPASKRAMEFVAGLDEDGDGWPEGLGNVERPGMGEEKLDNAVYTIRGYADLADMARALGRRRDPALGGRQGAGAAGEVRGRPGGTAATPAPTPTRWTTRTTRRSSSGTGSG